MHQADGSSAPGMEGRWGNAHASKGD